MKTITLIVTGLLLAACTHNDAPPTDPGPVQKAGAAIDHAAEDVKDAAKDTGEDIKKDLSK